MKVYLTGPITGTQDDAITDWRAAVRFALAKKVEIIDPSTFPYDSSLAYQQTEPLAEEMRRLMHGRFVVDRNRHYVQSSDVVLANFLNSTRASIGSIGELFWANAYGIPIVIVREPEHNVHDHAMLNAIASITCHSIDDGCKAVQNLLATDRGGVKAARR